MNKFKQYLKIFAKSYLGISVKENVNHSNAKKRCLLVYIITPWKNPKSNEAMHQNIWQAKELARIIGLFGYQVDVIHYSDKNIYLKYKYDLIVDIYPRSDSCYLGKLNLGAKKIVLLTGSDAAFAEKAEGKRIENCYNRNGVRLQFRRRVDKFNGWTENFDAALLMGNHVTKSTYTDMLSMPTYYIPNTGYNFQDHIDTSTRDARNFLYLGSVGQIHKGLDLLLEVFSQKDFSCRLFVCGPFEQEIDFVNLYRKELYHSKNIIAVGFINIFSKKFYDLAGKCTFALLPSCSEGQAGSIITCMSAGIIPICSKQCGFDANEVILLPDCSKLTIEKYVIQYSKSNTEWIQNESEKMLILSKTKFSKESYSKNVYHALNSILSC